MTMKAKIKSQNNDYKNFNPYFRKNDRYIRSLLLARGDPIFLFEKQSKPPLMMDTSKITPLMPIH